ncbi:MAG TPA: DUF4912 domain-containing protein [Firmicutes bacterium]|mgnify:CR=1 FL=1|nr:DUF4912 domain-containing protein [Candidatus Fermentithermobacillaceae bacterium]
MFWFYTGTVIVAALAIGFFFYRRARQIVSEEETFSRTEASFEASEELGTAGPNESHGRDRETHASAPKAASPDEPYRRNLRTDNLSKEVEVAWEAADIIDFPAGAAASPHEAAGLPPTETARPLRVKDAKARYKESPRLVLMARDPSWLYAYWNVAHEKYQEMYKKHLDEWGLSRPVLRLYDVTPGRVREHTDIYLNDEADNWYIRVDRPNHRLYAEIGRAFPDRFLAFARSNEVTMPPGGISMEIAEEWAPLAWETYYSKVGDAAGVSSPMVWGKSEE